MAFLLFYNKQKAGIVGVEISVTSESGETRKAVSAADGSYMLENITTGHYTFKVKDNLM